MQIGSYKLKNNLLLAPMAGITDNPFRKICIEFGAGLATSEMLSSNPKVWNTSKSKNRTNYVGESGIRSVQIAGCEPELMAQAAKINVENGAQIIDINMGCPAKKVNKKLAGSALLQNPKLVADILTAVVNSVAVPVTLKIRTGWDEDNRNGLYIARIAEDCGIQSLAVHGRTRCCFFKGNAEYDTIAEIKNSISIPVVANGDINSAKHAKFVLDYTKADGLMIGRAAQGNPWIFREIASYVNDGIIISKPSYEALKRVAVKHIQSIHDFYGTQMGVRIARKHAGWYTAPHDSEREFRRQFNCLETAELQLQALGHFFDSCDKTNKSVCNAA